MVTKFVVGLVGGAEQTSLVELCVGSEVLTVLVDVSSVKNEYILKVGPIIESGSWPDWHTLERHFYFSLFTIMH